ncbi:hypothetical protein RHO15_07095 [Utexia brackfieldae]|uniref:hypothetical protein n=1 Tax=Utexia brackfieldae TaxID=3074108 RepID=UPI00370DC0C1
MNPIDDGDVLDKITAYLLTRTSLTLCCVDQNQPYCCNCFYVLDKSRMVFYVTSSLNTHHARIMLTAPQVAGTINEQVNHFLQIKGVQYTGRIRLLDDEEALAARDLFCQSYPIAKLNIASMWEITLDTLKMTDNRLGFGKKRLWCRHD